MKLFEQMSMTENLRNNFSFIDFGFFVLFELFY